ncbi:MAG TPA: class III lanthionine synthetase LanKC [Actinospica sp.]|jgi:serine/threonine protein kinase|nr:class III lanthionine synthetase LanKC [Actinospica sp.]
MDKRYEAYCLADPLFYDHPAAREDLAPAYEQVRRPAPAGWSTREGGDWWHLLPDDRRLPDQGWKIHVSATPVSAPAVLATVWEHCTATGTAFKFLRSPAMLLLRNSKYAERGASGKFATLYPVDEADLERTLKQLDSVLAGQPGPYILSDLRYADGPLYVRYGGFTPRRCRDAAGKQVPAIADPDGHLVPDVRGPVFAPPPWARLPEFLTPHLAARSAASVADLPYRIESALHFSNGGGVYEGIDTRDGRRVVLKEGRPHAGLLADGRDAVARLDSERRALELADGCGAGPKVLDWLEVGEHRFLVLEHVPGRTLNSLFAERYPLTGRDPDPAALAGYTQWALGICRRTEQAIEALHACGVVFNDLHLFNIMVGPDDSVRLIDFEVAAPVDGQARRRLLAARAFQAPRELSGTAVDRYALACLRLALFLPLTALLPLDRSRARTLADAIRREFPQVPDTYLDEAVAVITAAMPGENAGGTAADEVDAPLLDADWVRLRATLVAGIDKAATPKRVDRLFPGDIRQFAHAGGGLSLGYGAAGVLYALHTVGAPMPAAYEQWLLDRVADLPPDTHLGLYDGVHGIAYVLDLLGHRDEALRLVHLALGERWQRLDADLSDGLAGIGLNLLHFARRTGDASLDGAALEAARLTAELLGRQYTARARQRDQQEANPADRHAGLMCGATGAALLFLRVYERTGDAGWLDRAQVALRMDLECCTLSERDGSMRVSEGWRALPYLAEGSAGIALVIRRYLAHREDETLRQALGAIEKACTSRFYAQSGLFNGRAGMMLTLADAEICGTVPISESTSPGNAFAAALADPSSDPSADAEVGRAPNAVNTRADGTPSDWPGLPPRRGTLRGPDIALVAFPRAERAERGADGAGSAARGGSEALDQARRLSWHAIGYADRIAFPGDQLHRLSTDLATGSAGVLLALGAVLGENPVHLPFLGPAVAVRSRQPAAPAEAAAVPAAP